MRLFNANWYYTLNHGDYPLLKYLQDVNEKFIVCYSRDDGVRLFAAYSSYLEFVSSIRSLPLDKWSFFEVILGETNQKLYFDIDIEPGSEVNDEELLDDIERGVENVMREYGVEDTDIFIFDSNGDGKRSYHVILNGLCVENHEQNKYLASFVRERLRDEHKKYIDTCVYKSVQQLRLYGSSKVGTGRIKRLLRGKELDIKFTNRSREILQFNYIFQSSCVTETKRCSLIPISIVPRTVNVMEMKDLDETMVEAITESKIFQDLMGIYNLHRVTENRMELIRKVSAHCMICDRVHDNDNGFIIVNENNVANFHCWRRPYSELMIVDFKPRNSPFKKSGLPNVSSRLRLMKRLAEQ